MPMIDNNVSVIKKWLDQGGDLSKLLAGYAEGSFQELKNKVDLLDDDIKNININVDTELSETSENPVQNKVIKKYIDDSVSNIEISVDTEMSDESTNVVQNKVIKKYIDENTAIKVDANNNTVGGDQESNKINENGELNSVEGRDNFIGISRLPAISGNIDESRIITGSNYVDIIRATFDDMIFYNKLIEENGVYKYSVYQSNIESIIDSSGVEHFDNSNLTYTNITSIKLGSEYLIFNFEFTDIEKYDYIISAGESFSSSNTLLIAGPDTILFTGEIDGIDYAHIEGYQNTALSDRVHVEGYSNIVGARAYRILEKNSEDFSYTLNNVDGLCPGDIYSIKIEANYDNHGKIISIDIENKKVIVKEEDFITDELISGVIVDDTSNIQNTFRIIYKPWLGNIDWADSAHSTGSLNRIYSDNASADGILNTIFGRYGRASGRSHKVGYAAHAQNNANEAIGYNSSASGYRTCANGKTSFTMGSSTIANGENQLARGKFNIPDNEGKYADIIGNGKNDTIRSNAYTLDWQGNAEFAGNVSLDGNVFANDASLESLTTALEIYGDIKFDGNNTFSHLNQINSISVDDNVIYNGTKEVSLLGTNKYKDILSIGSKVRKIRNIREINIAYDSADINKTNIKSGWTYSAAQSSDKFNVFFIDLATAKMTSGETILNANEIESILDFTRTDDAKCFLKAPGAENYEEFNFRTQGTATEDKTFWLNITWSESANKGVYRIWFCVSVNDTRITKDTFKKIGFNLYLVLKNPIEEIITDDFIGVWDSFKSVYNKNSVIFVNGIDNHNLEMSNIENSIDHSVRNALSNSQTDLDKKVDKVDGKGLSTNDFTDEYKKQLDDIKVIKTWEGVRNAVRLGFGATLFPVGYEFTTEDSVTGAVITWVVRGHDNHIAADKKLTHTMTLETKYVYGTANGTYCSLVFDDTEALYYAAEELPAGTYNFTLLAGYDTAYGGGKTLSFTLTKPVPAGGVIMFPWAYQQQSTYTQITTYASNAATTSIERVSVTESADGTSLGVADGTVENLNHTHRIRYGSNNYAQSAVRQWLNSDAAAGAVWAPTNKFDRRPSWATSYSGFMRGLPTEFLAAVQPAAIPCRTNSIFEVNSLDGTKFDIDQVYTLKDNFFLLSRPEIYGTWDNATYKDGTLLEFYEGLTDTERIKYDAAGSPRRCWLRSPDPGIASQQRGVHTSGALSHNGVYSAFGVAPACIIA